MASVRSSFPESGLSLWGACYLKPIVEQGVRCFLENGGGLRMEVRVLNNSLFPILVSDGKSGKASFAFPRGHYLHYPVHEIAQSSRWLGKRFLRAALSPLECLLCAGNFDKVVYLNHWLLVGAPSLNLNRDQMAELVDDLRRGYPEHALVVSGIVPKLEPEATSILLRLGGRAVQSRVIYLLDPAIPLKGGSYKHIRSTRSADSRLYHGFDDRRIEEADSLARQSEKLRSLYDDIYIHRHPGDLNPRYTNRFFELVASSGLFRVTGWRSRAGDVEAFNIQLRNDGVIVWSVFGADGSQPRSNGLLRLVATDDVLATGRENLMLNWGGGNDEFKRNRGAVPAFEYDIVFDRHLGPERRFPWWLMQRARAIKNGAPLNPAVPEEERGS